MKYPARERLKCQPLKKPKNSHTRHNNINRSEASEMSTTTNCKLQASKPHSPTAMQCKYRINSLGPPVSVFTSTGFAPTALTHELDRHITFSLAIQSQLP
eukprot:945355_1